MRSQPSTAFATRLPREEAERIVTAIERTGETRSEFVRAALRYYIERNPRQIPDLYPEESHARFIAELTQP